MSPDEETSGADPSLDAARSPASGRRGGHVVTSADARIEYVAPSVGDFLGTDSAELVGEPLASLFHPDDREEVREAVAARSTDGDAPITARLAADDGFNGRVTVDVTTVRSDDGEAYVVEITPTSVRTETGSDLVRFADSLEELHDATNRLHSSRSVEECTEIVIDAAVGVLGFDWCLLAAPTDDEMFRIEAVSEGAPLSVGDRPLAVDEGVAGHVYQAETGTVTANSGESARSEPTHDFIRSSLTAPVGNWGIFQALSKSTASFDETDLKLAEVLSTSMATAIERIEQERQLRVQRNELQRQYNRIESLHTVATEMKGVDARDAVYGAVIDAAEEILAFDICLIDEVDGDVLVPKAVGSGLSIEDYYEETPIDSDDNIAAQTVREEETIVVTDLRTTEYAPAQSDYRSILSVPLDDWGVFQAGSKAEAAFDDTDRRLTELMVEHAVATVDRIDRERELERRATELERQNERLDEFGSLVSHDLRTPLSIATGYLENARAETDHEALEEVADALDRMDALIDDMLALARGGREDLAVEPVALEPLVRERWDEFETHSASLDVRETLPATIRGDERRLEQLFDNLFRNCVEHGSTSSQGGSRPDDCVEHGSTSGRPKADDSVEHDPDDVTVRVGGLGDGGFYVADDGPGIPEAERDRVFEHGHSGGGGTGLGLAIVADIVDVHGWEIEPTEGETGGARFEIRTEPNE